MMKRLYVCILRVVGFIASVSAETRPATRLFTTSRCFDLIASLQYFDKIKNLTQFSHLASDSAFIRKLQHVNDNVICIHHLGETRIMQIIVSHSSGKWFPMIRLRTPMQAGLRISSAYNLNLPTACRGYMMPDTPIIGTMKSSLYLRDI